jgi:signal transduction histidine kinase
MSPGKRGETPARAHTFGSHKDVLPMPGRFSHRLQYRITLLVWGTLLVFGLVGSGAVLYLQRQATVATFEQSTISLAATLADTIERDMLLGDRSHIQESVTLMASRSPVTAVTIISNDRTVYVSAEPGTVGQIKANPDIVAVLEPGSTKASARSRYDQNSLYVAFPVENKQECHVCHGAASRILGAIEIGRDSTPLAAQGREQTIIMTVMAGLTFAFIGTVLGLTLRSAVVTPLAKVADAARRIAAGDLTSRVAVARRDEVGMVARAFNDMAAKLELHAGALQERTLQLQQMAGQRGELLERLISAQEEERRRLARELHDEVGQALSSIMLDLAIAVDELPPDATAARERLSQSRAVAAQTMGELRKVIYDLRPEVLDQLGLIPALRSYAKSHLEGRNIRVQLRFQGLKARLPLPTETTLFRVMQEAITNVIRHSGATMVTVEITVKDSVLAASVADNGRGFDVDTAFTLPESWGLRGIRERAISIGGELTIESQPDRGTRVKFEIPLEDVEYG